jgi:F-type H+-transporting ATPase subunit b
MHHEESFFADPRAWVAVAFVIFFLIFGKKIWSIATALLDKRADTIRHELSEAERLRAEAEVMLKDATARREQAKADAEALLAGARREAARLAAEAEQDAINSAARREKMAMDRIAAAEKAAIDEVRIAAANVAAAAAESVLREHMTAEAGSAIVDRAIAQLPAAMSGRRAA